MSDPDRFWPRGKVLFICLILFLYVAAGIALKILADNGTIAKLPPTPLDQGGNDSLAERNISLAPLHLAAAERFLFANAIRANGHVDLYLAADANVTRQEPVDANTNSEAVSYAMLWTAQADDRPAFDREVSFVESAMADPVNGHLRWRLTANDTIESDGANIASDADLRAIKALLIAEQRWKDVRYTKLIDQLARGLERAALTKDGLLAPYGGDSGNSTWTADLSWLSYSDFTVFRALAQRRGEPWVGVYSKMKRAVLGAQLANGLYNSELTAKREYGNGIDAGGYGINSLWIMVRNAESGDPELMASANRSLDFYRRQFSGNGELYALYDSSGDALSPSDSPWVYALVGRAAVALHDDAFADVVLQKLFSEQVMTCGSSLYGAFPEGSPAPRRGQQVGQFTMQESVLTMQAYLEERGESVASAAEAVSQTCGGAATVADR